MITVKALVFLDEKLLSLPFLDSLAFISGSCCGYFRIADRMVPGVDPGFSEGGGGSF